MKLTSDIHSALAPTYLMALPQDDQWSCARLRLRDGSYYVLASKNLGFTLVRMTQARLGITDVAGFNGELKKLDTSKGALGVVTRHGGLDYLDAFTRCRDEASAQATVKTWREGARKRNLKLADTDDEEAQTEKARALFGDARTASEKADF